MAKIHPSSFVDPKAELADSVEVGPFCVIEEGVQIGENCKIESHAVFKSGCIIGNNNTFAEGVIIGGDPQDHKYQGQEAILRIGNDNKIREFVTLHRGVIDYGETKIGDRNFIMAYSHVGHNSLVMDDVTITNSCGISGHVTIEHMAVIGGMCGIHQFVRVGRNAMVGGMSKLTKDVPPFMIVQGQQVIDINAVGLRRMGVTQEKRLALHKACRLLFNSQLGLSNALEIVKREVNMTEEVEYLIAFLERLPKGKNGRGDQK